MGELFNFIFDGINERYQHELMLISQQYPFEPIEYLRPPLRITFQEGITLLRVSPAVDLAAPPDDLTASIPLDSNRSQASMRPTTRISVHHTKKRSER